MQGLKRGRVRVAMITTAKYFATRLIGDFCRAYPEVDFALEVVNRDQILERMRQNLDDLYIMGQAPEGSTWSSRPSPTIRWSCSRRPIIRSAARAIAAPRLGARALHSARAGIGHAAGDRALFRRAHDPADDADDARQRRDDQAGGGGRPRPRGAVAPCPDARAGRGPARTRRRGFPILRRWHVVHLADKRLSPLARAFLKLLKDSRPKRTDRCRARSPTAQGGVGVASPPGAPVRRPGSRSSRGSQKCFRRRLTAPP